MTRTSIQPTLRRAVSAEDGTALPIALIVLVILTSLSIVFTSLATTEPVLSRNHSIAAQARGYAESAIERALWALNNPTNAKGLADPLPNPVTSPDESVRYDGSQFVSVSPNGGFTVAATGTGNERTITAVGWAPDTTGQLRAAKKIRATLARLGWTNANPNCALCIKGVLDLGGNAEINALGNYCAGSTPLSGSLSTGNTPAPTGSAEVYGPGDTEPNGSADILKNRPDSEVNYSLTTDDLELLRAIAQANGTYYRGAVEFNSSNRLPDAGGVVFVDTTTGADLTTTPSMTPTSQMGNVTITGNQTWSGWLIAMGDITISGTVSLTGSIYARNDFVFSGNGTITGTVTAENMLGTTQSSVDSVAAELGGSARIAYHCQAAKTGGGTVQAGWTLKPGSYLEVDGISGT
ncbi:MAG: hypothetical protein HYU51_14630 [Candidatus Rokubacteria bacterium]|nr:hypothetical protein [Candidatus Rokubacteria bacterium]